MQTYRLSVLIGAVLLLILFAFGVAQDPGAFVTEVARIPQAWALLAVWLAVSVVLFWLVTEALSRLLFGKTLLQMRQDGDTRFEQNLLCAGVIALAIILLVAQGRAP